MSLPRLQTAVVQSPALPASSPADESLPLAVSDSVPIPVLPSSHHVLVRVLAVALNPTDFKMVTYFPRPFHGDTPALPIGCDFCGVVEDGSESALRSFPVGTRVCGGLFPYGHADKGSNAVSGAFAQWVAADANQLLRVPDGWDDLQGATVGGICWGTCVLALFEDPEALALPGRPSKPEEKGRPVVVYGGATATGTMACQLLKL
jgi:NADPH:quinone reductase-like Zn-dependent oxidoreductase